MTDTNTLAPTDAEIDAIADQHKASGHGTVWPHAFARAVLNKWGTPALASSEPDPMLPETKYNLGWASGWDAHARAHPPEKPAAVPASGPVGFDHKTAANFLNGKTVADEEMRRFVAHSRWAHDDRDVFRNTIAGLRREIAQRDAEIALLKTSLLDAEAPQPPAQAKDKDETKAQRLTEKRWLEVGKAVERACIELPQWAEVVVSLEKDAGTVKWFDGDSNEYDSDTHGDCFSEVINNAIDAAIAAQQGDAT